MIHRWSLALFFLARAAQAAEPMVSVVVAAEDLPAGVVLTMERITQREVPRSAVTASFVKPDSVSYLVNQSTRLPILKGEPLLWSFFETRVSRVPACDQLRTETSAAAQVAHHRALIKTRRAR
jgi:Flp pilus assembly protein CpaB